MKFMTFKNKKGNFVWDHLGQLILVLAVLIILIVVIWLLKDAIVEMWDGITGFLRFGS